MAELSTSRILTLVFTDLADSTALKSQLGDQRVGDLITRHRALVSTLAAAAAGRVIDWAGDGCFLTFETPSAAVTFALHLQEAHGAQPDLPGVRTGIHMGEVSERPNPDGDALHPRVDGLAVDLTARISGLARPGQILMSATVADSVRSRLEAAGFGRPIRWHSHGAYALKGFDKPLEIVEAGLEGVASFTAPVASDKASATQPAASAPAPGGGRLRFVVQALTIAIAIAAAFWWMTSQTPDVSTAEVAQERKSIAVLPFVNMSSDAENEYFSDGITEDLLTALSKVSGLKVAARTSSFAFKGKNEDIKTIGEQLRVTTVLEGSVAKVGDRVRITAQLINVEDGYHLWSETYDRELKDVFAVRSEVAETVAKALRVTLNPEEHRSIALNPTDDVEAYQLYLKARYALNTLDDWDATLGYLERAIALDPTYALAWLGLAEYFVWSTDWGIPAIEALPRAREAARKALVLDPTLAEAHAWLGMVHFWYDHDIDATLREFDTALTMQPDLATARSWFGYVLVSIGRTDEGIATTQRAYELDALGPNVTSMMGLNLLLARRNPEAIAQLRTATTVASENWWGHALLARAYAQEKRYPEAIAEARVAVQLGPQYAEAHGTLGRVYADAGDTAEAEKVLAHLRARQDIYVVPHFVAVILIGLGRNDEALDELVKADQQRSWPVMGWKVDPDLDPLRADPRLSALLKQVGLE